MDSLTQMAGLSNLGSLGDLDTLRPNPPSQGLNVPTPQQTTLPEDYNPTLPPRMGMGPSQSNIHYFVNPQDAKPSDSKPASNPNLASELTNIIKARESNGNYQAVNPKSTASGAYQYTDSTWNGYGGYAKAALAPPKIQDEKFANDVSARLAAYNNDPYKAIVAHYLPAIANQPDKWSQPFKVGGRVVKPALSYLKYVVHGTPLEAGLDDYLIHGQPGLAATQSKSMASVN